MNTGPLRRAVGTVGLVALTPTAYLVAVGHVTPLDAATRAAATLVGVLVVGRVARLWLSATAAAFERARPDDEDPRGSGAPGVPGRVERRRSKC